VSDLSSGNLLVAALRYPSGFARLAGSSAASRMLKLPNVSLLCLDTRHPELAVFAMQRCLDQACFGGRSC
jgi:hypothetical protein